VAAIAGTDRDDEQGAGDRVDDHPGVEGEDPRDQPFGDDLRGWSLGDDGPAGHRVFLDEDDELTDALSFQTVLSLPFLLDGFVPMLSAAVDGNPATEATR
jgi:hypothetical protein